MPPGTDCEEQQIPFIERWDSYFAEFFGINMYSKKYCVEGLKNKHIHRANGKYVSELDKRTKFPEKP